MRASVLLRETAKRLEAVTPDARFEAKELVCGALGCSEMQLRRTIRELSADQRQQLEEWVLAGSTDIRCSICWATGNFTDCRLSWVPGC